MNKKYNTNAYTDKQVDLVIKGRSSGLSFVEIADLFNKTFKPEKDKSPETLRSLYTKYQDYDLSDDELIKNIRSAHSARKSSSKVRKENKALLDVAECNDSFLERFEEALKVQPIKLHKAVKVKKKKKIKRAIFGNLSDLHIQANICGDELGGINKYGNVEEARRLAFYMREIANYKTDKRDETELVLPLNGDLGQGVIHNTENTTLMVTQFSAMLHLLTQAISYAASHYGKVTIPCSPDNHLRFMHKNDKGRSNSDKYDSFATMLHVSLRYALKDHKNVEFIIPSTPYTLFEVLGHRYFMTHGDTVVSFGSVGKVVSTESIKNKVNDLIAGLGKVDCVLLGHQHIPLHTSLNNGVELVMNGTLSGIDSFAQSIGILVNNPSQVMFEATEDHVVGDVRFVRVREADSMEELDKIIEPFKGKF